MLLSDYLEQWLATFCAPFRAPSTVACYRRAFAALPPSLMSSPLQSVSGMSIQAAINAQAVTHPRAAQLTFAALHVALQRAVALDMLPAHPMRGCIKPAHTAAKAAILTPPQLSLYLAAARASPAYPLLLVMAGMGLRRGEALGLTWAAVDLSGGVLHVRQQRMRIAGSYSARPLKSDASRRSLPIPPPIASELARVRAAQHTRSIAGWVCDITPEALARHHAAVLAHAGLPHITLHGLRHSMATAAVSSGCPIKILQGVLGHSGYQLTADLYANHLTFAAFAPHMVALATSIVP